MIIFKCLFVLCCFYLCYVPLFYFFQSHSPRKRSRIQGLMLYKLYNPDKLYVFRNIKSGTPQFIFDGGVSPKVWTVSAFSTVSGVLMHFWTVLNDNHVFLDFQMTYDLF